MNDMIQNTGWANDAFGNSWTECNSTTGTWYDDADFETYTTETLAGQTSTALDGKLTPSGYILDGNGRNWPDGFLAYNNQDTFCRERWGDGKDFGNLECEDGNNDDGDGWDFKCGVESGYTWTGGNETTPDTCHKWGNGILTSIEACDDGNTDNNDGWDSTWNIETDYTCDSASPTVCQKCSDSKVTGNETWDDGGLADTDGCNSACFVESGYQCTGEPSNCTPIWGDGLLVGSEQCDDGNNNDNEGCSSTCTVEAGWTCVSSQPSICSEVWGDTRFFSNSQLTCDDGNTISGDGWSNDWLTIETGYQCTGGSSTSAQTCFSTWGDNVKASDEPWDNAHE